jgi:DNA-nicking Smr family endonuclease
MMRRPKGDERSLWREAMRDVMPLRSANLGAPSDGEPPPDPLRDAPLPRKRGRVKPGSSSEAPNPGLDRRSAQRLKRGQMAIAARLDLHGMTQDEAHRALHRFITHSAGARRRNLLVITGKSGVLHGAVPRWLDEPELRALVLAKERAQAKDGGSGALYVLLRRQR